MSTTQMPLPEPIEPVAPAVPHMTALTVFEKILLGIVSTAPAALPLFVHSQHGILIANASENLLAGVLQQFAPKQ